ncbi:hypothetical protein BH09MYX1_BH09MYX1_42180 [soil metagenome]
MARLSVRKYLRPVARLTRISWVDFLVRIVRGLRDHEAFQAASAMAFNFFLSFIPLLVVLGSILGHIVRARGVDTFLVPVQATMPFATELVRRELERLADSHASIAPVATTSFLWMASSGTRSPITAFEVALGASRRGYLEKRAIAIVWVLGMIGALSTTLYAWITIDGLLHPGTFSLGQRIVVMRSTWEPVALLVALGVVGTTGLAVLYRYGVEHPPGVTRRAWPGAVVASVTALGITFAFGRYVGTLANYALFYGSAAAVATLLVWLYLASLALLLGAEVNAQLEGLRSPLRRAAAEEARTAAASAAAAAAARATAKT